MVIQFSLYPGCVTVIELGLSSIPVADRFGITQPAVSRLAQRGEKLVIEKKFY